VENSFWLYLRIGFQAVGALCLAIAAFLKFSGHPATIAIFSQMHLEPLGRYSSALTDIVVAIFLLLPGFIWAGAIMGLSILLGALFFHGSLLGLEVQQDHGMMFRLAVCASISCGAVLYLQLVALFPKSIPAPNVLQDSKTRKVLRRRRLIRKAESKKKLRK
jgi:putative oxidoreductase